MAEEDEEFVHVAPGHDPNRPIMEEAQRAAMAVLEKHGYKRVTLALCAVVTAPYDKENEHAILSVKHMDDVPDEPGNDPNMRVLNLLIQNFRELALSLGMEVDLIAMDKPIGRG